MYRPDSLRPLKRYLDYDRTWAMFWHLKKNPERIRPAAVPEHLLEFQPKRSFKLPRVKSNVMSTMEHIIHIFIGDWKRASRDINIAIRTTCTSLAKRCDNDDPKTAYRHILALIDAGWLRAKVHVRSGIQLLINPEIFVFSGTTTTVAATPKPAPSVAPVAPAGPVVAASSGMASLLALAAKFTAPTSSAFLKNPTRA